MWALAVLSHTRIPVWARGLRRLLQRGFCWRQILPGSLLCLCDESAYITFVAQKVAEVKGMELERIAEITSRNAELLFRI